MILPTLAQFARPTLQKVTDGSHSVRSITIPESAKFSANPIGSPKHIAAEYYYKIPVRPIYKQYPVYAPGCEPAGYMDWLSTRNR